MNDVTLYREIDALGGTPADDYGRGYSAALNDALKILAKRGFTEASDASFTCTDCSMAEPEWCMKATHCPHRDGKVVKQLARVSAAAALYREAPFRSAEWLAGVVMTVLETAPANDVAPDRRPINPRPDRNCDFCGPGWKGAHKYRCPRAHEDNGEGGPVDD